MNWFLFALVGSVAQLIDGALGMGFGLTSSTFLLTLGASAALASAAVHIAEIGTTLASGASHWHAGNIDKKILIYLAVPGGIGALLGATFLSFIDLSGAKVFISTLLLFLGFLLLYRNVFERKAPQNIIEIKNPRNLMYLGFTGGFVDASGGGGWGPLVSPTLMATTQTETRKIIGTVNAAEFIVAISASIGFLLSLNRIDLDWMAIGGLALGGVLTAPIAARAITIMPRRLLGTLVGITIILINGYRIISA